MDEDEIDRLLEEAGVDCPDVGNDAMTGDGFAEWDEEEGWQ